MNDRPAPPLWFGPAFLVAGIGFAIVFATAGQLVGVPLGGLFAIGGAALTATSLRARRPRSAPSAIGAGIDKARTDEFTRSPMQALVDTALVPIGAIGFLVMAVLGLGQGPLGILGAVVAGFFGLLLLRASAIGISRGFGLKIATVGQDGLWTRELGRRLAWSEIGTIRVEQVQGVGGVRNQSVVGYRRLAILPRDPSLAARSPSRGTTAMLSRYVRFVNSVRPGPGLSDPSTIAPFGILAVTMEQPFDDLVRSVSRFAPIEGADSTGPANR